jgi:twitching motility protein PilT
MASKDYKKQFDNLLMLAVKNNASDLHLGAGRKPILRIDSVLKEIEGDILKQEEILAILQEILTTEQYSKFNAERDIDFSYGLKTTGRFRCNAYFQLGKVSCAIRFIPQKIMSLENLNLPPVLNLFCQAHQGFVLVTGPSGHGKSTTLAALIDEINHTRQEHIITIEDPIEYVFANDKSVIDQREVLLDTQTFDKALRATFRQDPNVIMVGEMRDAETIATAITAAETGHLVFATLHTNSAAQTIHRIVDSFEGAQQKQIRAQLAASLLGIVSQRLIPCIKGGTIPACEIIFNNAAISHLIRDNKIHEMSSVIETSMDQGMITLNKSLAKLVKDKEIKKDIALKYSLNTEGLKTILR